MSYANGSKVIVILSSKLLIYANNYIGPNTDPCGTPLTLISSMKPYDLLQRVVFFRSAMFCSDDYAIPDSMGFLHK